MDSQSSSSTLSGRIWKHDVFLGFNGEDIRNFTDNLMAALQTEGLDAFSDDKVFKIGEPYPPQLLDEIEDSKLFIYFFPENYFASISPEEFLKFAEMFNNCPESQGLLILYHVEPSLKVSYRLLLQHHDLDEFWFKQNLDKFPRLGEAINILANRSSFTVQKKLDSQEVIDHILNRVQCQLGYKISDVADANLVGIQRRMKKLEKLLHLESYIVQYVGICGMGGIGKTALAAALYDSISHRFDYCCFLANISAVSKRYGLTHQQQLLCNIRKPKYEYLKIKDIDEGAIFIRKRLNSHKTLLVLDDVDQTMMIKALAGSPDWFGIGSRIIITTRDKNILRECGVDQVYKAELLNKNEALQFCQDIFGCDYYKKKLIDYIVEYAKGLPLAIKSVALKLLQRAKFNHVSLLEDLLFNLIITKNLTTELNQVLKESFDALCDMEKEIFLHLACFFVGENINYVKQILCHLGFDPECGIRVLLNKSLITISNQRIEMHYLLQELGRQIVQQENRAPGLRSRLWRCVEFLDLQMESLPTTKVKGIVFNHEELKGTPLKAEAFSKLGLLRLLIVHNVIFSGSINSLSNELRYISWDKYPFTYLPSSFEPQELVELVMPGSNITQLWEDIKMLPKLRSISLRGSEKLIKTPDFGGVPNLERLDLEGCTALLRLHPSIAFLSKLTFLNLRNCISLINIPDDLFSLSSLQILNLAGCSELAKCLNFDPLRSSTEATLLSIRFPPFLAKLLSNICICFSPE